MVMTQEERATTKQSWYERNKEPAKVRRRIRCYKMDERMYNRRVALQGNACAICKREDVRLGVDHDHGCCDVVGVSCGRCVRSLLCSPCNSGLGAFRDSPELLERAVAYLAYWRDRHGR